MECNNKNEMIKFAKLKLHIKYILGISVAITALVIVAACFQNSKFVDEVAFASTISSIILSVIAIIITIIGEEKTDNTKNKLVDVSDNLSNIVESINMSTKKLEGLSDIDHKIDKLDDIIDKLDNLNSNVIETKDVISKLDSISFNKTDTEDSEDITKIYNNIEKKLDASNFNANFVTWSMYYVYISRDKDKPTRINDFISYMKSEYTTGAEEAFLYMGIMFVFMSIAGNEKLKEYIYEKMDSKENRDKKSKISSFIDNL